MACGYVGMLFVGGNIPAGHGARDHGLGQQRVVDARRAAAVHLDGRDPVPHRLSEEMFRGLGALAQLAARAG